LTLAMLGCATKSCAEDETEGPQRGTLAMLGYVAKSNVNGRRFRKIEALV
jgi:hypothetical protein